jgi:hypothetical protein
LYTKQHVFVLQNNEPSANEQGQAQNKLQAVKVSPPKMGIEMRFSKKKKTSCRTCSMHESHMGSFVL